MNAEPSAELTPTGLIFGREPAVWTGAAQGAIAIGTAFGLPVTLEQQGAIMAAVSAVLGLFLAWRTRPVALAAFMGLAQSGLALGTAFGTDISVEQQGLVLAAASVFTNMVMRGQLTPAKGFVQAELEYVGKHRKPE